MEAIEYTSYQGVERTLFRKDIGTLNLKRVTSVYVIDNSLLTVQYSDMEDRYLYTVVEL